MFSLLLEKVRRASKDTQGAAQIEGGNAVENNERHHKRCTPRLSSRWQNFRDRCHGDVFTEDVNCTQVNSTTNNSPMAMIPVILILAGLVAVTALDGSESQ